MSRRQPRTAAEVRAELTPTPAARAQQEAELDRERAENLARYRAVAAPVLADLAAAGFPVAIIADLQAAGSNAKPVVPVLLQWLPRVTNPAVRADIIRVLGNRWAKAAAPTLIAEFRTGTAQGRWAIGNALAGIADDRVFADIAALARDRSYGRDREMVVLALANMKDPAAVDVLLDLVGDHEVTGHAVMALGKLRAQRARPVLEKLLEHPQTWIRREAKKALNRLR